MEKKHIDGYDCIDDNLSIILKSKSLDIRKIFSNLWYFEFDENSKTLGEGLMKTNDNKYQELKENFNIQYKVYKNESASEEIKLKDFGESEKVTINRIDQILKTKCNNCNIIILEVDTFKYRFDKGFKKYRGTHSCIITDIRENYAKIVDVWYKLNNIEIKYEELLNAITRIIVLDISKINEKKFNGEDFKKYILDEKSISEMKIFFSKIQSIDLKKEYMNLDFEMLFKAPIDKGLRKIIMNRQRFSYYLYYLSEQLNNKEIMEIGECIFIISMDWAKLRNILIQEYFLNKNINIEKLNNITKDILNKEIKIKKEIEEIKW